MSGVRPRTWRPVIAGVIGLLAVFLGVMAFLAYRSYRDAEGPLSQAQATLTALAHNPDTLNSTLGRDLTEIRLARASIEIRTAQHDVRSSVGLNVLGVLP